MADDFSSSRWRSEQCSVLSTVLNTDDTGTGSLREAIALANKEPGADTIEFARTARGEIELSALFGELLITDNVTIDGPGQHKLTVSGEGVTRVFRVVPEVTVSFQKLTIADGLATDAPDSALPDMAEELADRANFENRRVRNRPLGINVRPSAEST